MTDSRKHLYSASCNPPRRAKRHPIASGSPSDLAEEEHMSLQPPRPILPKKMAQPMKSTNPVLPDEHAAPAQPAPAPSKRGRKPGPLSRTAREAQRRLNHSIIEKARRTKINEALATLKQLVPADYGYSKPAADDDEDDDDEDNEDEEYQQSSKKPKPKKGTGKKEEKEKEFKLEILIRTVSFMQDLIKRVTVLEEGSIQPQPCLSCAGPGPGVDTRKRKRSHLDDIEGDIQSEKTPRETNRPRRLTESSSSSCPDGTITQQRTPLTQPLSDARLPSISSWLPISVIDPSLLPPPPPQRTPPTPRSYLPSPPSSTHFDPVRTSQIPPALSLGPVALATRAPSTHSSRTPEDESAASLLLQISASSPPFRALSSSSTYGLPDPSKFTLHTDAAKGTKPGAVLMAQTPGSLLGLNHRSGKQ